MNRITRGLNRNLVASLSIILWAALSLSPVNASSVDVIVISDMPYSLKESHLLSAPDGAIYRAIHQQQPQLVMHLGDIKRGSRACSDKRLLKRKQLLEQLWPQKIAYTPGDNEWTDCDRFGHNELERLQFLRQHFTGAGSGLQAEAYQPVTQTQQPENIRWQIQDIGFITVHIPGTNFGRDEILQGNTPAIMAYALVRERLTVQWLQESFQAFKDRAAIVVGFHADIFTTGGLVPPLAPCTTDKPDHCDGYIAIRNALKQLALAFNKPVLMMHGDTQDVCIQPIQNTANAAIWRLNAAGDGVAKAIKLTVNTQNNQPFTANFLLDNDALPINCYVNAKL